MPPASDESALLAAICAAPDDDAPRLVYADWLDEYGAPARAAHLRMAVANPDTLVSVCLRRSRSHPDEQSWGRLDGPDSVPHELELSLGQTLPDARAWRDQRDVPQTSMRFRRGLVESLTCSATDWIAHADTLVATHPVRDVTLTTWPRWERQANGPDSPDDCRLVGRTKWWPCDELAQPDRMHGYLAMALLCEEWPSVRSWCLPPLPDEASFPGQCVGTLRQDGRLLHFTKVPFASRLGVRVFPPTLPRRRHHLS